MTNQTNQDEVKEEKNYTIKNRTEENNELTLEIEIDKTLVEKFRDAAIKEAGKEVEVKGFRKGAAPDDVVIEKVGEMKVLEEQSYRALYEVMPVIVLEEKIEALTSPQIQVTKIAAGSNLELKAIFTLMPRIELSDYTAAAKSVKASEEVSVTDKEIDEYIDHIRKNKAEASYVERKTAGEEVDESEKEKLPELNDEFIKTLGDFKSVDEFKTQLKENMLKDKQAKEQGRRRTEIIEKVITESKIDLPDILVEEEKKRMLNQYRSDIEQLGIGFDEYMKELKKTEEDLLKEWSADAVKRAKMNLILPKIAEAEKLTVDAKKAADEVKHLMSHHPDVSEAQASAYIMHILTNESVFEFLEKIK